MHGYKIRFSCMKGTIFLIEFVFIFESKNEFHFKTIPHCARFGAMLRKINFQSGNIRSHGRIVSAVSQFSALRALGGDVKKHVHFQRGNTFTW